MASLGPSSPAPAHSSHPGSATGIADNACLAGDGPAIQKVRAQLLRIAPFVRQALIVGESGTGKYAVAALLHSRGSNSTGSFQVHDAVTFAETLSSEDRQKEALRTARGGTLFLHRVCQLSPALQTRLLHLLRRQGELRSAQTQLRILGSARRDLRTLALSGHFQEELYRRLAAVEITLPPLRKRLDDLEQVVASLLPRLPAQPAITSNAILFLRQHAWPENIRELKETLQRAVVLADGATITQDHLLLRPRDESTPSTLPLPLPQLERLQDVVQRHVLDVLGHCSGNKLRASEILGISRSTLYRMLDTCPAGTVSEYTR